jgi:tetratricopeptide (TPR) repeat protein
MEQNVYERARQLNRAGGECLAKGDLAGAIENFSKALKLLPEDQLESKARMHNNLGHVQVRLKRYDDALSSFKQAVEAYDNLGHQTLLGEQLGNLGSVYRDTEQWEAALESYSKSLAIFQKQDHKKGVADQCSNIGYAHFRQGRVESAFQFFQQAKALYDELGESKQSQLCDQNLQAIKPHLEKCKSLI